MTPSICPLAACSVQLWDFMHIQQLHRISLLVLYMLVCLLLLRMPSVWARFVPLQMMPSAAVPPVPLKHWLARNGTQSHFSLQQHCQLPAADLC